MHRGVGRRDVFLALCTPPRAGIAFRSISGCSSSAVVALTAALTAALTTLVALAGTVVVVAACHVSAAIVDRLLVVQRTLLALLAVGATFCTNILSLLNASRCVRQQTRRGLFGSDGISSGRSCSRNRTTRIGLAS